MGREDFVSDAAEQASTVDTGGEGSDQLVIPESSVCSGSSDSGAQEQAQDDESGDGDLKGKELRTQETTTWPGTWGCTKSCGADGGRMPTRARR